jgi:hypothetical protein
MKNETRIAKQHCLSTYRIMFKVLRFSFKSFSGVSPSFPSGENLHLLPEILNYPLSSLTGIYLVFCTGESFSLCPTFGHALLSAFYTTSQKHILKNNLCAMD